MLDYLKPKVEGEKKKAWVYWANIFQRHMNTHRVSLQLIFIYTKLFRVLNYLCDIASQGIDGILVHVNLTMCQVGSWTRSAIIFSILESRVGCIYLLTCRILSWFPNIFVDYQVRKDLWNCHLPYFSHLRQIVIKVVTHPCRNCRQYFHNLSQSCLGGDPLYILM